MRWSGASPLAVRSWSDDFKTALLARFDEAYALQLFDNYAQAFPAAYTEDFAGDAAALDVTFLEAAEKEPERLHLDIYRPDPRRKDKFFLKIFRSQQDAIPISDLLPMLENMGLKVIAERPYGLEFPGGAPRLDSGPGARHAGSSGGRNSTRWTAKSRAPSPPCGPAAWTTTASIS